MDKLKEIAEEIAMDTIFRINREAMKCTDQRELSKYPAQHILEELIKILESKV